MKQQSPGENVQLTSDGGSVKQESRRGSKNPREKNKRCEDGVKALKLSKIDLELPRAAGREKPGTRGGPCFDPAPNRGKNKMVQSL